MPVRRPRDIEEPEEEPREESRRSTRHTEPDDADHDSRRSSRVRRGWAAAEQRAESGSGDGSLKPYYRYEVGPDAKLVRFLDRDPISYNQHWINRRPYICLEEDCPACDSGDNPRPVFVFTVVDLAAEDPLPLLLSVTSKRFFARLRSMDDDPKYGPLTANYIALSKSGTGVDTTYTATWVKERDLEEDYDITPEDAKAFCEDFEPVSEDYEAFKEPTRADIRAALRGEDR